jgi:hypothetical protein
MPDRIDASMKLVKAAGADPMVDCPGPEAQFVELAPGNDPMLPLRKLRHSPIGCRRRTRVRFALYVSTNLIHVPIPAGSGLPIARQMCRLRDRC